MNTAFAATSFSVDGGASARRIEGRADPKDKPLPMVGRKPSVVRHTSGIADIDGAAVIGWCAAQPP
ncbi:hypothetical protein [Rhodopseudomonas pseudopalustris]|uniref:hypothetical protein n=1 Tax=Rhodopseudomonas pseudopalustris TaxID=1513892 RepID=UPI001113CFB9|nr:hypothetical protein [Rhodopseudomonas pseudopalustris]MBB1092829.1 hypothetical protein [Rhodopseudomonas palustris]